MSRGGMPSAIGTTSATPAAADSRIASAAKGAGTKIRDTLAPVSRTASSTVSYTLMSVSPNFCPPRPGVTPATTFVPYSMHRRVWKLPSRPVMPCTRTLLFRSTKMLICCPLQNSSD